METKAPKSTAKKPYEAPALKEWGTLKDITLTQSSGRKSDGGKGSKSSTN